MFNTDKSIVFSFMLLAISAWSAWSFYWTGYYKGKNLSQEKIVAQQHEISKLRQQLITAQGEAITVELSSGTKVSNLHL